MILLDSHVLLWWLMDDARLGGDARRRMSDASEVIAISTVSLFEIETKRRLGKLHAPEGIVAAVRRAQFDLVPLHADPAALAGTLAWSHRDPFDRLLVAVSRVARVPLLTSDRRILEFEPSALDAS